jgi:hypothetical protein
MYLYKIDTIFNIQSIYIQSFSRGFWHFFFWSSVILFSAIRQSSDVGSFPHLISWCQSFYALLNGPSRFYTQ